MRPDPDELLAHARHIERRRHRGRLKIFLGYAAGVGKTYAMLDAARQRQQGGVDVVAAYVETHGRADTQAKLEGLEAIPRAQVMHRGVTLEELDLDAVLARRPQLALVDELAHTNAPGGRHVKRYMDVDELLAHGIDVYTTVNIQHLESFNDVVAQITGVTVRETIPDGLLDEADEIELVDLPPEELLDRLREGKVYVPERAALAIERFFRKGNLTALREIALRRAAERVDDQMRDYMSSRAIPGPWPAAERLLVCVSPSPASERLVRIGRRLADQLDGEWFALYVETHGQAELSEVEKDRLARTLLLAESLGAKTVQLPGHSVADTVAQYARSHNVTKIVVGEPRYPRWLEVLRGSVLSDIVRKSGDIDVYVISAENEERQRFWFWPGELRSPWYQYLKGVAAVALATALGEIVDPFLAPTNLVMVYLLAVVVTALRWGRGPSALAAVSALCSLTSSSSHRAIPSRSMICSTSSPLPGS